MPQASSAPAWYVAVALAALIGLAAVAFAGCAYQRTIPFPATVAATPVVRECKQAAEANFVETVNAVAAGESWQSGLATLVAQTSLCAVRVAAQQLIAEYAGIKMEPGNVDVAGRLKAWLADHPPN